MLHIPSQTHNCELDLPGLRFTKNVVRKLSEGTDWFSAKVSSSPGPLVSDFVTHGPTFEYSTFGIHIGQDDRLTFFGNLNRTITGHFIDCREDSPSLHQAFSYTFSPSEYRRLVIPRGVAHTFDGLAGIVTRDEPVWYASEDNPHWNVNNDLISILRSSKDFPSVSVCQYRFSDDLHNFMTRLSQSVLSNPKAYSTRFKLRIAGEDQYVMFQENTWNNEGRDLRPLLAAAGDSPVKICRSKYAITGKASWTLVPNTASGVADVLFLEKNTDSPDSRLFVHRRTRRWYTFLNEEGSALRIETLDLRPASNTFGYKNAFETICDPRISFVIEPGVAYRFNVDNGIFVRAENEIFVSENEPREDIPMFGSDLEFIDPDSFSREQPELPSLLCSDRIVRKMAGIESQSIPETN
jgi:dTDP-4-dehydrorhamnose 3,5-epimerase-like enzyme